MSTDRIQAAIAKIGGKFSSFVFEKQEAVGIVGVRFENSAGLMETRWGVSLPDLARRIETCAKRVSKKPAKKV